MLYSKLFIPIQKDVISKIDTESTKLMLKSGMIHQLSSGVYEFLPLGVRVLRKIQSLIRREMNYIGGQEVILPLLVPKHLLLETNRWSNYGKELFKLKDRKNSEFCLIPTAEEVIVDLIRNKQISYKQLPIMLYQFGSKFRDEIRPRYGLVRAKEFLMKDAYSFHSDEIDLNNYYDTIVNSYKKICQELNINCKIVKASSGKIGGSFSNEFIAISNNGEEDIAWCEQCGYSATKDIIECFSIKENQYVIKECFPIKEVFTPTSTTISDLMNLLKIPSNKMIKTIIYIVDNNNPIAVLIRGDHEINEDKLKRVLNTNNINLANTKFLHMLNLTPGFLGPVNLKQNIKIIADLSVLDICNALTGANKSDYHLQNVNYKRDYTVDIIADIRKFKYKDLCPQCKMPILDVSKGIEIGHTFKLDVKYSKLMNGTYVNKEGKKNLMYMGCYGIGVTRLLVAIVEQCHDKDGIIWPKLIAPFDVIIIPINFNNEYIKRIIKYLCNVFHENRLEVLIDDRQAINIRSRLKDADLIGVPYRVIINKNFISKQLVELKCRKDKRNNTKLVHINHIIYEILGNSDIKEKKKNFESKEKTN